MANKIEKRYQAYNKIYGSDIFNIASSVDPSNEKPKKKMVEQSIPYTTQIKLFGKHKSESNIYGNQQIPHKESRPIAIPIPSDKVIGDYNGNYQEFIKPKTGYDRFLREFHNFEIESTKISNTKGFLSSELKKTQPSKKFDSSFNRIESLKSNIFNDGEKENENISGSQSDWKNSQSELVLKKHKSINGIAHCQTLEDYYKMRHNQNILSHKFKIFPANNIDSVQLERECKEQGIHIYDVEKHSDWLNGHGDHLMLFDIRENDLGKFKANFSKVKEKIEKEKGIQIKFASCSKIGKDIKEIDTKTNIKKGNKMISPTNKQYLAMTIYQRPISGISNNS